MRGIEANELLTSAAAALLTALLLAEGVTLLDLGGLRAEHMFVGMALIPPVLLKLSSVGYRFIRYYTGARAYREKGPPLLPLRVMAPFLIASTLAVLGTGVWLMVLGRPSDGALFLHKASFVVWGILFGVHFLAYLPRTTRSLRAAWTETRGRPALASGLTASLLAASLGGGIALAVAVLSLITGWHGGIE